LPREVFKMREDLCQCRQPTRMIFMGEQERINKFEQRLMQRLLGNTVRMIRWIVSDDGQVVAEIIPKNVSKAVAAKELINYLGLRREQVVSLGDQYNDIELLAWAGMGIAMGDAPSEVAEAARVVTLSCAEDGAAIALEQYVLEGCTLRGF